MNDFDTHTSWHSSSSADAIGATPYRLRLDQVACRDHDDMMAEMGDAPRRRRDDDDCYEPRRRRAPQRRSFKYVDRRGHSYELVRQDAGSAERLRREKTFVKGVGHAGAGVAGVVVGAGGAALLVSGAANLMHHAPQAGVGLLAAGAVLVGVGWTLLSSVWDKH